MPPGARKHDESSSSSNEAVQQATVPAPVNDASAKVHVQAPRDLPPNHNRETTVPDYDVEALAAASFHGAKRAQLPLDLAVPIRNAKASPCGVPLRAAFLLSHVDDRMSIAEIAHSAQLPITDAIECFTLLADLGVVELHGRMAKAEPAAEAEVEAAESPVRPTPKSGLRPKT